MPYHIKCIIFDIDGTLVSSTKLGIYIYIYIVCIEVLFNLSAYAMAGLETTNLVLKKKGLTLLFIILSQWTIFSLPH
jgi:hypothetical protein